MVQRNRRGGGEPPSPRYQFIRASGSLCSRAQSPNGPLEVYRGVSVEQLRSAQWVDAFVEVTPELAEELLTVCSAAGRACRPSIAHDLAYIIENGQWDPRESTHPVELTADGVLLGGHHRLTAVVAANRPVVMWFGLGRQGHFKPGSPTEPWNLQDQGYPYGTA